MLDSEQRLQLLEAIRHGNARDTDAALKALFTAYWPLVKSIHIRRGPFLADDELQQLGYITIWKAATKYDASFGTSFSTYLYESVSNALARAFTSRKLTVQATEDVPFDVAVPDGSYGDDPTKAEANRETVQKLLAILTEQQRAFAILLMTESRIDAARSMGFSRQRAEQITKQIARKAAQAAQGE